MEFERALFRVYERALEAVVTDSRLHIGAFSIPWRRVLRGVRHALVLTTVFLVLSVASMHHLFVDSSDCLQASLRAYENHLRDARLGLEPSAASAAAADLPPAAGAAAEGAAGSAHFAGQGIIGQNGVARASGNATHAGYQFGRGNILQLAVGEPDQRYMAEQARRVAELEAGRPRGAASAEEEASGFEATYRYSSTPPLLFLGEDFLTSHRIWTHNVTIDRRCLVDRGHGLGRLYWLDQDSVVLNHLLAIFPRQRGSLMKVQRDGTGAGGGQGTEEARERAGDSATQGDEGEVAPRGGAPRERDLNWDAPTASVIWSWSDHTQHSTSLWNASGIRSAAIAMRGKLFAIAASLLALFLVSTVTAMLVRHLIASGVALVIPILEVLRRTFQVAVDGRIIAASYPWLMLPMHALQRAGKPAAAYIASQIAFLLVIYVMYEAAQVLFGTFFYPRLVAKGQFAFLFALVMVCEYFSMIFLRSRAAIRFTPRAFLCLFLIFHLYVYSWPAGFFQLTLCALTSACFALMLYTVDALEARALQHGEISLEQPRGAFVALPYPQWSNAVPALWTLFMPVNTETQTAYQARVPPRGGPAAAPGGGGRPRDEEEGVSVTMDAFAEDAAGARAERRVVHRAVGRRASGRDAADG